MPEILSLHIASSNSFAILVYPFFNCGLATLSPRLILQRGGQCRPTQKTLSFYYDHFASFDKISKCIFQIFRNISASLKLPRTTVSLKGNIEADSLIVDASKNYTFNGNGAIVGKTTLVKRGTGMLTLQTDNTYTGGTRISGGVVSASSLSNENQAAGNFGAMKTAANKFIIENGDRKSVV